MRSILLKVVGAVVVVKFLGSVLSYFRKRTTLAQLTADADEVDPGEELRQDEEGDDDVIAGPLGIAEEIDEEGEGGEAAEDDDEGGEAAEADDEDVEENGFFNEGELTAVAVNVEELPEDNLNANVDEPIAGPSIPVPTRPRRGRGHTTTITEEEVMIGMLSPDSRLTRQRKAELLKTQAESPLAARKL